MRLPTFRRRAEPTDDAAALAEAQSLLIAKDAEIAMLRRELRDFTEGALAVAIDIRRQRMAGRDVQSGQFAARVA